MLHVHVSLVRPGLGSIDMAQVDGDESDTEVAFDDLAAEIEAETKTPAMKLGGETSPTTSTTSTNSLVMVAHEATAATAKKHSGDSSSDDSYVNISSNDALLDLMAATATATATAATGTSTINTARSDEFDLEQALLSHQQEQQSGATSELVLGDDAEANLLAMLSSELNTDASASPAMDDDALLAVSVVHVHVHMNMSTSTSMNEYEHIHRCHDAP